MTKRLLKRHKRQVARAKQQIKVSEPDVRTPEEVQAAREASGRRTTRRNDSLPQFNVTSAKNPADPVRDASGETDV